ncbi:hypothetical protein CDCA_CDCA01G0292 [Cyanidium caldarium]|uniref:Spindle and kinetochore-associated protein 1 n=1 Tax=Cyanidium caldarium TaxID=2771 RepID=A0AAV9IPI6_CYACA|nr:hypothetical protein CDCA_CDCA01G0292 [Cyanidium caldarium]
MNASSERSGVPLEQLFAELVTGVRLQSQELKALVGVCCLEEPAKLAEQLHRANESLKRVEAKMRTLQQYVAEEMACVPQIQEVCREAREQRRRAQALARALETEGRERRMNEVANGFRVEEAKENEPDSTSESVVSEASVARSRPRHRSGSRRSTEPVVPTIAPVSEHELSGVPGYIRGRVTLERLHAAVEEIHAILTVKYRLLARPQQQLSSAQLDQRCAYHDMETDETAGRFFFSDVDVRASAILKQDATGKAVLNVLRHLGRLKESRGGTHCRIWVVNEATG